MGLAGSIGSASSAADRSIRKDAHPKVRRSSRRYIKYAVENDLIIANLPNEADRDKALALLGDKSSVTRIIFPKWVRFDRSKIFRWKGSITIQTIYKNKEVAKGLSCYGRGTTHDDVTYGKVTLGFHEWCHRKVYVDYIEDRDHSLPLPMLKAGLTEDEFRKAIEQFEREMEDYDRAIRSFNDQSVDEVGHKKSKYLDTKQCYPHKHSPR